tara:strand:- start:25 stop:747 length:723 start_codon:yes stop_codon:yes gene_type:complete
MSCSSCESTKTTTTTPTTTTAACGCEEVECPTPQPCTEITDSECIIYTGEELQCGQDSVVPTNTSLSLALKAIVDYVCKWIGNKRFENTLPGSVTGTTNESILSSMFIPANSLEKNDIMRYEMMFSKESTVNGSVAIKAYINSTPDITGSPILFANFGNYGVSFNPNASGVGTKGLVVLDTTTDTKFISASLINYSDYWSIADPVVATAVDWTANQYIVLTCTPNNIADTVTHIYSKLTK